MLRGELVALRPVRRDELPTLYAWRQDLDLTAWTDTEPWVALSYDEWSKRWDEPTSPKVAFFGVQEGVADDGRLVGTCKLWGIDEYNRNAHIGIKLGAESDRGKGFGRDALALLVRYGFWYRGLHRLQLETFADNTAMRRCAERVGFTEEGRLRESGWAAGRFGDDVIYGLLATEWATPPGRRPAGSGE
ncbi:MAG: GNAT family N-acetyltransferase [Mycobacteriales bacterium]